MNLEELIKICPELANDVLAKGKELPEDSQYNVEYALQYIGRVAATANKINLWLAAVKYWHENRLMTDVPPDIGKFIN